MKKVFIIFFALLLCQTACYSQLQLLIGQQTNSLNRNLDVYEQYNFSLTLVNKIWVIKTLNGEKDILVPKVSTYYETFNKQFLLVTQNKSPLGYSGPPYFFPRGKVYIYPIKSIGDSTKYCVDFGKLIINQDNGYEDFTSEFYLINEISIEKLTVSIYNPKLSKYLKFSLQKE